MKARSWMAVVVMITVTLSCSMSAAKDALDSGETRPISLAEVLQLARTRGPSVATARARVTMATAELSLAKAPRLPGLGVSLSGSSIAAYGPVVISGTPSEGATSTGAWAEGGFDFRWLVVDGGRVAGSTRAAQAGLDASVLDAESEGARAMAMAAGLYFAALRDDEVILASRTMEASRERQVVAVSQLVEAGMRAPYDELRARIGLETARLEVEKAMSDRRLDGARLAAAIGADPGRAIAVLPASIGSEDSLEGAVEASLRTRPEVRAAAARVDQAQGKTDIAKAASRPTVALRGGLGVRETWASQTGGAYSTANGTVTLAITTPILDPTGSPARAASDAALTMALAEQARVRSEVRLLAIEAALAVRNAKVLLEQSTSVAAAAEEGLAQAESRFRAGLLSTLELLDAQRAALGARVAVADARLRAAKAAVELTLASGRSLPDTVRSEVSDARARAFPLVRSMAGTGAIQAGRGLDGDRPCQTVGH